MSELFSKWQSWGPKLLSILRVVAAFMFMSAGTMKLFGVPSFPGAPTVQLFSQLGLAGVLETFGGFLLLVGLWTRPVAFILSGEMAVAYFQVHAPQSFWPIINQGQSAVFYCFLWLYLSAVGGGAWSIDAFLKGKKQASETTLSR